MRQIDLKRRTTNPYEDALFHWLASVFAKWSVRVVKTMWLPVRTLVTLWLVTVQGKGCGVMADEADDARFMKGVLSVLPVLRPARMVIQQVKRAAPELFIDLPSQVRSMGYPLETHKVRTEDGYLLTLFRIPRGRENSNVSMDSNAADDNSSKEKPRPPVLLQHGIFACADQWILEGPGIAPALVLADLGYDVWMNNIRGNEYSKKHESMKRKDPRFWYFSWHEIGYYDIPAVIDHILNSTGQEKLTYIGHSMGNTMYYVAMTMRPEYNDKIRLHIALAPAIFFDDAGSAPVRVAIANVDYIKALVDTWPTYELYLKSDAIVSLYYLMCCDTSYFSKLCAVLYSWTVGATDLNNTTDLYRQVTRGLGSTSVLVPWHFAQNMLSGDFRMMDHGAENMEKYGSARPPKYPLDKVTVPVAMYGSEGDFIAPAKGVRRLSKKVKNLISLKIIEEKFFNHMDFIFHPQKSELLWNDVLETMERYKP